MPETVQSRLVSTQFLLLHIIPRSAPQSQLALPGSWVRENPGAALGLGCGRVPGLPSVCTAEQQPGNDIQESAEPQITAGGLLVLWVQDPLPPSQRRGSRAGTSDGPQGVWRPVTGPPDPVLSFVSLPGSQPPFPAPLCLDLFSP